ncbi:MAG: glycosyltransferase [Clostridia bacterium]|nr:glycosyltransferase [Clostridia bacterium]
MKIVQINAVCGKGSTGRTTKELSDTLNQSGMENLIISTSDYIAENHVQVGSVLENKLHALFARIFGYDSHYSYFSTRKIIKTLKKFKPDVVHLRNLHGNYVNLPKLLKFLSKNDIATVITLHDCWFFTGKCTHYTTQKCYNWKDNCGSCPQLKKDIPSLVFDKTSKQLQEKKKGFLSIPRLAVVGVSDWITNEAKKSFLKDAKIIRRIYNWIDLDVFYPREVEKNDKFTVLCIGAGWNENSEKLKDLIKLSKVLPADMEILLAGSVSTNEPLPSNVKKVGYVSSTDELAKLYSKVDAYVHLSREDTFGKVIAEALACGTPAIVYNSTACPELIGKGCGYVVEVGGVNAIVDRLKEIKSNGKGGYLNNCVKFVKDNFDKQNLINETVNLYNDLLNR